VNAENRGDRDQRELRQLVARVEPGECGGRAGLPGFGIQGAGPAGFPGLVAIAYSRQAVTCRLLLGGAAADDVCAERDAGLSMPAANTEWSGA
jgi:hypothetical protein